MHLHAHTVHEKPFRVHLFDGLLAEPRTLRAQLNKCVRLHRKDNDLYRFAQSADLRSEPSHQPGSLPEPVLEFVRLLVGELRPRLERETGLRLSEQHLDVTVSRYKRGDYLLCHNDHLKYRAAESRGHRRALAFVYYLTRRPWQPDEDGGALALYGADAAGEPVQLLARLAPVPNRLLAFETSELSWHAVEEVLCSDDTRLSINGWFHTDWPASELPLDPAPVQLEPCPQPLFRPVPVSGRVEKFFRECVNQDYLSSHTCALIRRRFKRKSEINLVDFLVPQKYKQISEALARFASDQRNLTQLGPYNKRHYSALKQLDQLPPLCRDLYEAFRSELFYLQLSRLTGLELQPPSLQSEAAGADDDDSDSSSGASSSSADETADEPADEPADDEPQVATGEDEDEPAATSSPGGQASPPKEDKRPTKRRKVSDPLARFEFRHFQHGSYTLIHDHSFELAEKCALDVMLHFNHDFDVNFRHGGFISYIDGSGDDSPQGAAAAADDELLTIEPKSNCLSLVYRADTGTCRFVKHINKSHAGDYQDLSCVFYERPDDLPAHCNAPTSATD